jgi:hypothetical protein
VAAVARNVRFHLTSVRTRDGIQTDFGFVLPSENPVTGLAGLKIGGASDIYKPMAFDNAGNLYVENPVGSGSLDPVPANALVSLPADSSLQVASAYKRGFLAFTDLANSSARGAIYDIATGNLDPLSMLPMGEPWAAGTYAIGEVVTPSNPFGGNGHSYRCIQAGVSGNAQPVFPVGEGATVADGGVIWKENTPFMAQRLPTQAAPAVARVPGGGAFAAARDVYIIVTLVNGQGETDSAAITFKYVNTVLNDQFVVTSPTLPTWVANLIAPYAVTGYNVYEADVATGAAAPLLAAYKKVNGGLVAIGVATNVNTTGAGAAPTGVNNAGVVPVGNICAGLRYAFVFYINRNGYFAGVSSAAVFSYTAPTAGLKMYIPYIPIGPANTQARVVAFTPAGTLSQLAGSGISSAGPYFWIPPAGFAEGDFSFSDIAGGVTIADIVSGVQMTSTMINDNVTTTATFNFTDDYLKSTMLNVSDSFRKIRIPDISDAYFAESIGRMLYSVDSLPSGWYVSAEGDPETVYGDTGLVQVAENNGQNRVAVREFSSTIYLFKERSGHVLQPDATDPVNWKAAKQWDGSGPCGKRALDVCTTFLCYVHRSGVYIYAGSGSPKRISKEIPISWSKINWKAAKTIWVMIDDETSEIRIGVPYGQSTVPNMVLKCNFEESPDFEPPIHFSPYMGKEIAAGTCYKWSVDEIAANLAVRMERPLVNPPVTLDLATQQSQILYASSNPDGAVAAIVPLMFNDNGEGIDSTYETAAPQDLMRPNQLGGVQANIAGSGNINLEILALRAKDPREGGVVPAPGKPQANLGAVIPVKKKCQAGVPYSCGVKGQNERFRLRVSNGKQKDVWFDLQWASIHAKPLSSARPNS